MDQERLYLINEYVEQNELENAISEFYAAASFLKACESYGLDFNNYSQILELNQNVIGSLSMHLERYQQFLLSPKVLYDELHTFDIMGGKGHLTKEGIFIPKSFEGDEHFLYGGWLPKVPYTRHWYEYPKIDETGSEYDMAVSRGLSNSDDLDLILRLGLDFCFGDVLNINSPDYNKNRKELLLKLSLINRALSNMVKLHMDKDSTRGQEIIMLERRSR